ncbi:MAG: 2OG-Fe(II) oxygenase [Synechococcus sp. ELA619]|jgi:hypothetical protein
MSNFIVKETIDTAICDGLVDLFNKTPNKKQGVVLNDAGDAIIDEEVKASTDIVLNPYDEQLSPYMKELASVVAKYIELYPMSSYYAGWEIRENVNIQYYKPGQGYKKWHTERLSASFPDCMRHLVFMTYLNDVADGGTEFYHQNLVVEAKKGLTLIWPADWTFTHRGVVSNTSDKYIITGWFSYF